MRRGDLKSSNVARGDSLTLAASFAGVASLGPITAFIPNDPKFGEQWHLLNTGASGGTPGIDINITDVWNDYTGTGVVIGIIDDGVQHDHPDLSANYDTTLDHDARDGDGDAAPGTSGDNHGTTVAGTIAGVEGNGIGGTGVAVAPGTGVGVTVGVGVAVGIGVGVGVGPGVGAGTGVGVGVGTAVGAATGTGVTTGTTAVSENRTTTDRSLFMTTVACPSRLPSAPVQTTDPGAETVIVTMVPGW